NDSKSAIIAGVGPALGSALLDEFSKVGYVSCGLSRSIISPFPPQKGIGENQSVTSAAICVRKAADVADYPSLDTAISEFLADHPPLHVAVYNAARFLHKPFEATSPEEFTEIWETNFLGAVHFAKRVIPELSKTGGTLIFTGATASVRGGDGFSAFASSKFALRGLAQSLARTYQNKGVHIAHAVLDGTIAHSAASAPYRADEEHSLQPADIAKCYLNIIRQPRSAWTHEFDLRPYTETF
ncbi:MAG TPA: SDR family NAD(P)-dependent oxidoreductase, partial [Hellea balneolensis]|nr:SDR family NAD(P)-dependent oxidoreductase [Hellea balneolensis]